MSKQSDGKNRRGKKISGKNPGRLQPTREQEIIDQMNEGLGAQVPFQVMPEPSYLDRTKPDRDRFQQRIKPHITKDHIKDLLRRGGDFFQGLTTDGTIAFNRVGGDDALPTLLQGVRIAGNSLPMNWVPESGVTLAVPMASLPIGIGEPRWRPGRDKPGAGGGGPDASDDPSDLVFLDVSWEELAEMLALLFDLPFLDPKEADKILTYRMRIKGIKKTGPQARLDLPATYKARLERFRAIYNARPEEFPGLSIDDIPTVDQFPYDSADRRFKRIEEEWDPDSKAVVFFEFDTSGSMGGEPMAIARFYFLLNLIWLRARYGEVDVVLIPHNAQAFRVTTEKEFFTIDAGGGTIFSPAHELAMEIRLREYPSSSHNAYAFHATDGFNFEDPSFLAEVIERMLAPGGGNFNFFGYLEIDPYGYGSYTTGGMQAILQLSADALNRTGAAKVHSIDEVPDAMRAIVAKDQTPGSGS
jgi:uncharacterized sporulation protein YeaH/YhbH (DUF444 family)